MCLCICVLFGLVVVLFTFVGGMACCSQLPTLLSPAPSLPLYAPQLIRALSLSWYPIPGEDDPIAIKRQRHLIPTRHSLLFLLHSPTHTYTDTSCNEKVSSTFFASWNGRSFLGSLWCFSFIFFVLSFLAYFFFGSRRRKWVIYIFDELSLLNATNQRPSVSMAVVQETMPTKVFAYYKINIIYLCDSWQATWRIFVYHWHFSYIYINNNMEFFFVIFIIIYLDFFSQLSWVYFFFVLNVKETSRIELPPLIVTEIVIN